PVPGGPLARAALAAQRRAHLDGPAAARAGERGARTEGDREHRVRGKDAGPPGRGPARRLAHRRRQGEPAARGRRPRGDPRGAGEQRGATFRVRLPLVSRPVVAGGAALPAGSAQAPLPTLDHVRVLVVDDEPNAREVLTALLAACGAEVGAAASVREALERV